MPYQILQRIEDEVQARELGDAVQLAQHEFRRLARLVPATRKGAAYATAIAQEIVDRVCLNRGYRVAALYEPNAEQCTLQIEQWLPET